MASKRRVHEPSGPVRCGAGTLLCISDFRWTGGARRGPPTGWRPTAVDAPRSYRMLTVVPGGRLADPAGQARVTLLIPARNEERNIAWVLRRVPPSVDEVIVVDGRSTDRTVDVVRMIRPDARVVPEVGRGKGAAVRTGISEATGQIIVMIDADGSMDPGEIDRYLQPIAAGAEVVKGSRFLDGGGTT